MVVLGIAKWSPSLMGQKPPLVPPAPSCKDPWTEVYDLRIVVKPLTNNSSVTLIMHCMLNMS